jgi:hypothetical protein
MRHAFEALSDQTEMFPGSAASMFNVPMDSPTWKLLCRVMITELEDGTMLLRVVEEPLSM